MQREMRCRFVTFEGVDGSGKTSVASFVAQSLRKEGLDVVLTTEPTHTWLGDAVKRSYTETVNPFTEALLFMADRATHTDQIRRWLGEGKLVLSDRYCDSTYAYQAAGLKGIGPDPMNWLKRMSKPFVTEPGLTVLLDVEPRLGLRRIAARSRKVHFENEPFLRKVRANYLMLAKSRRFVTIDASKPMAAVKKEALRIVSSRVEASTAARRRS